MKLNQKLNIKLKDKIDLIKEWDSSLVVEEVSLLIESYSDSVKIYNYLRKSDLFEVDYFVKGFGLHYIIVMEGK